MSDGKSFGNIDRKISKQEKRDRSREYYRTHKVEHVANKNANYPPNKEAMQKRIDDAMKAELARERRELEEMTRPEPEDD